MTVPWFTVTLAFRVPHLTVPQCPVCKGLLTYDASFVTVRMWACTVCCVRVEQNCRPGAALDTAATLRAKLAGRDAGTAS